MTPAAQVATGWVWVALAAAIVAGVGVIAFPTFYVMPFRTQDASVLGWALTARSLAPAVTLGAAVIAGVLAIVAAARARRWWSRLAPFVLVVPLGLGTWFARQNHFEWMFAPQDAIEHVDAGKATFVQPDDLVMAVLRQGAAVAYPIRQLAYHHIANDVIACEPVVATY